ncbi:hypothetical protein [Marinifilum caeruleilacunae]|uniref:Uncharacterized protein n=1 Tax=Marinifilum caeruleilacunae TaxID=2499076 RepID=A0ABX1WY47_9BACT|nr:hypothetical protein [Marinifilum caeruleilacunae]NOU60818.1 hypothetical protein [Marinifilum caeruleilacunae]
MQDSKKKALIDIIESMVIVERTFTAIERLTGGIELTMKLSKWWSLITLLGLDSTSDEIEVDKACEECRDTFLEISQCDLSSEKAAETIYNEFDRIITRTLAKYPKLKAA